MFNFIGVIFIIFLASTAVGTMPALKGRYPFPFILIYFALVSVVPVIVGIVLGAAFLFWLPAFLFKVALFILSLFMVAYFLQLYHPSYGYIPHNSKGYLFILSFFFFLLGIEFASYGFSAWFLLLVIPISVVGLLLGFIFMTRMIIYFRYLSVIHFVPIGLFLFVGILKLI
ncbi:hypothetical protein CR194_01890 [Salipaludibacillus keqinensis]|uniref:Uncharacterized protein n=1 Tax=Salipaludibacillus keqinensis TaxID=2045207 RepID=A0A323THR1_9BACI|nr:hypothetical protein [Salipaludibacillus keqinensis]PYZ94309.1 hypothetical protein CR194_01890 [Salipaludibacillus keqinensis]